jgi:tRNA(Leu) C34 or U34 (ribose-2'-O)-methylase TrmL
MSIELTDEAVNLHDVDFSSLLEEYKHICFVVGNETTGVPSEITHSTTNIFIPMPGVGACLNTSQAANIIIYEAVKQMS